MLENDFKAVARMRSFMTHGIPHISSFNLVNKQQNSFFCTATDNDIVILSIPNFCEILRKSVSTDESIRTISVNNNGTQIAALTQSNKIFTWDVIIDENEVVNLLEPQIFLVSRAFQSIFNMEYGSDNQLIIAFLDGVLHLYNQNQLIIERRISDHQLTYFQVNRDDIVVANIQYEVQHIHKSTLTPLIPTLTLESDILAYIFYDNKHYYSLGSIGVFVRSGSDSFLLNSASQIYTCFASDGNYLVAISEDCIVAKIDPSNLSVLQKQTLIKSLGDATGLHVSIKNSLIYATTSESTVFKICLETFDLEGHYFGTYDQILDSSFINSHSAVIATSDNVAKLLDFSNLSKASHSLLPSHSAAVVVVDVSDSTILSASADDTIHIYSKESPHDLLFFAKSINPGIQTAVLLNSSTVAIGLRDGSILIYSEDLSSNHNILSNSEEKNSISHNESQDKSQQGIHSPMELSLIVSSYQHRCALTRFALSSHRTVLASSDELGIVKIWKIKIKEVDRLITMKHSFTNKKNPVQDLLLSDRAPLVFAAYSDGTIAIWNYQENIHVKNIQTQSKSSTAICFGQSHKELLYTDRHGAISLIDIASGSLISTIKAHSSRIWTLSSFQNQSETLLFSGCSQGQITIFTHSLIESSTVPEALEKSGQKLTTANLLADINTIPKGTAYAVQCELANHFWYGACQCITHLPKLKEFVRLIPVKKTKWLLNTLIKWLKHPTRASVATLIIHELFATNHSILTKEVLPIIHSQIEKLLKRFHTFHESTYLLDTIQSTLAGDLSSDQNLDIPSSHSNLLITTFIKQSTKNPVKRL